ncbi:MAG: cation transporter [Desulfatitalea sp.]|nr:cation transporter [Desulfatitalea sp.]
MPPADNKPAPGRRNLDTSSSFRLRMGAILLSVGVSVLLLALKFHTYRLTGSAAVLSDALESIINVVASGFATISIWMAAKPPDLDHPYGHGKIEYFSAGFEGALIIGASVGIFYTGVTHLINPQPLPNLGPGLAILGFATAINLLLGLFLIRVGRRTESLTLLADGKHILTDVYTSGGVLAGLAMVHWTGWLWLDGAIACLVGVNILITGGRLVRLSFSRLMHKSDPVLLDQIARALEHHRLPDWVDVHQLRAWRAGLMVHIDLHLVLPGDLTLSSAHKEAKRLERLLIDHYRGHAEVLVHMDPCASKECPICDRPSCDHRSQNQHTTPFWNRERLIRWSGSSNPEEDKSAAAHEQPGKTMDNGPGDKIK